MNRQERERRRQKGQPEVSGSTRQPGESRRAVRRRLKRILPPYRAQSRDESVYWANVNSGARTSSAAFEG